MYIEYDDACDWDNEAEEQEEYEDTQADWLMDDKWLEESGNKE